MTRWSTPSKRPQTRMAPGPALSAAIRACVSGTPRGDNMSRGRSSLAVVSMARPSTSGFITMPGPPPAGVSSTVRCLSAAYVRLSTTSSVQAPDASALPARLAPNGPGNMSGKIVSTLARHILPSPLVGEGSRFLIGCTPHPTRLRLATLSHKGRGIDHDPSHREIDCRHVDDVERYQFSFAAGVGPHLDEIAGAEIVHGDDAAERPAGAIDDAKPDQVGVIELVRRIRLRQPLARHIEFCIGKPLRGIAVGDARQRGDEIILGRP